ncbi:hypothetical protein G6F64_015218 [Rhizopus arrhizus]|uniref:Uncharacterized protein n=1 Tax=Rhizopus oryzae TaxID=64495 RepID=A0A9P6WSI2_RHIOR|nr:hypothetical protein G6F64_015218 [Rhizopus arrhizus]
MLPVQRQRTVLAALESAGAVADRVALDRVVDQVTARQVVHGHGPEKLDRRQLPRLEPDHIGLASLQGVPLRVFLVSQVHRLFGRIAVDAHGGGHSPLRIVVAQLCP